MQSQTPANYDPQTVEGFGKEWQTFDQSELTEEESSSIFQQYFGIFPFDKIDSQSIGFDFGCGSGRWAKRIAPMVRKLHLIDASHEALESARRNTNNACIYHWSSEVPLADNYADFGYSLGVLHHIPDTEKALRNCVRVLKKDAPFLLYVYYDFENRAKWFRGLWKASDVMRQTISRLPFPARYAVSQAFALSVYFPLARGAGIAEKLGFKVESFPLSHYRNRSFYTMRTDALDRFGTKLEKRFSKSEVEAMMQRAGLTNIRFADSLNWVAVGFKK